jgi:hypothetical protein
MKNWAINRDLYSGHPGRSRGPGRKLFVLDPGPRHSLLARGLNVMTALCLVFSLFSLSSCKPTYKKETIQESVKELAEKEYNLDVEVAESKTTLGIRFQVGNLLSEMYSGDDDIYKKMNGLFTILARVSLSIDQPPEFVVLQIVDQSNPDFQLVFTRYVEDIRKSMAEALSYTQSQDRLLQEFVINGKRIPVDPEEMDLVRMMMLAMDSSQEKKSIPFPYVVQPVEFNLFLSRVSENYIRRIFKEKKNLNKEIQFRNVTASFSSSPKDTNNFKILLDLVPQSKASNILEEAVFPLVLKEAQEVFRSYRFNSFAGILVMERNSGKSLTLSAK